MNGLAIFSSMSDSMYWEVDIVTCAPELLEEGQMGLLRVQEVNIF